MSRDRSADPIHGLYNICYINAFQAQPGTEASRWWHDNHPDLLLRNGLGGLIVDEDWNEPLLDISTEVKRAQLAAVVNEWIDDCHAKGYQAVEPDNLDSYQRSLGSLTASDSIAFASMLSEHAHAVGLAVAQKNTAELLAQRDRSASSAPAMEPTHSATEASSTVAVSFSRSQASLSFSRVRCGAVCRR
ncbi:endo alpha-1,4 polygalactosaminidase [Streptomyces sp. NPDC059083]|uniref:endo alpha-1,4 polygalactosaminidase n=1 Tax=Streptomyces sp. NPDC059083 TaxID=3346721 RepID=UPI00369B9102